MSEFAIRRINRAFHEPRHLQQQEKELEDEIASQESRLRKLLEGLEGETDED